jgi:SET domain-containing protein
MPKEEVPQIKRNIAEKMREWLRAEGDHDRKFDEMLELSIPLDETYRGVSVFAKRKIQKLEVLGAYSGKLHEDAFSLSQSIKKNGVVNVHTYMFGTRSEQRSIDAYNSGNILSCVNTAQLSNHDPIIGKSNNVGLVIMGRNLNFYVALKDIEVGSELFIDYGPRYDPYFHIKAAKAEEGNPPNIKTEAEEQ